MLSLPHPIHSNYSLSNPKSWRSFTLSSTIEASPPRRSLAGASPEIDTDELHHPDLLFFLGEELPQQASSSTSFSSSSPSKEDDPELLQAFPDDLKPLPVTHSTPVSVSPPRSIRIALGFEAKSTNHH